MRLQSYLNELFDTNVDITMIEDNPKSKIYSFIIKHQEFRFLARKEGDWEIIFGTEDGKTGMTGKGDAVQIFAAVSKCLDMFIKKFTPVEFYFTAKEPSRKKLYKRITKIIVKKYPYDLEIEEYWEKDHFIFTRK